MNRKKSTEDVIEQMENKYVEGLYKNNAKIRRNFNKTLKKIYELDMGMEWSYTKISEESYDILIEGIDELCNEYLFMNVMTWLNIEKYEDLYKFKSADQVVVLRDFRNLLYKIYWEENQGNIKSYIIENNKRMNSIYKYILLGYRNNFSNRQDSECPVREEESKKPTVAGLRKQITDLELKLNRNVPYIEKRIIRADMVSAMEELLSISQRGGTFRQELEQRLGDVKREMRKEYFMGGNTTEDFRKYLKESLLQGKPVFPYELDPPSREIYENCKKELEIELDKIIDDVTEQVKKQC